jgi:hypothetical protein
MNTFVLPNCSTDVLSKFIIKLAIEERKLREYFMEG